MAWRRDTATTCYSRPMRGLDVKPWLVPERRLRLLRGLPRDTIESPLLEPIPSIFSKCGRSSSASEPRPLGINTDLQSIAVISSVFSDSLYSKCLRPGSGMPRKGLIDIRPSAFVMKLNMYWPMWHAASAANIPSDGIVALLSSFATQWIHTHHPHSQLEQPHTVCTIVCPCPCAHSLGQGPGLTRFIESDSVRFEYFSSWVVVHRPRLLV